MIDSLRPFVFALVVLIAALPAGRSAALMIEPRAAAVVAGRTLGALLLVALSLVVAIAAAPVPMGLIAFAGFFPLLRGLRKILSLGFRPEPPVEVADAGRPWLAITRQTITGGMDTLALLIPIYATHTPAEIAPVAAAVVLATALLATWRPAFATRGARLVPAALVLVGIYLLIEGGAFNWLLPR
jgi:cadmium resistance protein CadD (predicted permease)